MEPVQILIEKKNVFGVISASSVLQKIDWRFV